MKHRRDFLCNCAIASLMGITFSINDSAFASGLVGKKRSFCSFQDNQGPEAMLGKKKWSREH